MSPTKKTYGTVAMDDLHDLAIVAQRKKEQAISMDEMKRRLVYDGILKVEIQPDQRRP